MVYRVCVLVLLVYTANAAEEGETCVKSGVNGVCVNIRNCQAAIDDIKKRKSPQICGFSGTDPIVCCVSSTAATSSARPATTSPRPVATTTSTRRTPSTTEYVPPVYDYKTNEEPGQCEPVTPGFTAPKTGQKAWDKCIEYQEKLVYPCEKGVALTGELARADHCKHKVDELIVGGTAAALQEFPHMVLLGFGSTPEQAQWVCGGTLISERFILTAGHCTSSRDLGEVTYARTALLKRTDQIDATRLYKVKRTIKHPAYKPPSKYNDIALLETESMMKLDQFAVPACLHVGEVKDITASATGWGDTEYGGSVSNILQKVTLTKFPTAECIANFPSQRNMKEGFDANTQICYGDRTMSKDTCQGDSGGPLQVHNPRINCMYTIVGVTSFGKACGWVGQPGIYTRVAAYVPWIESVVWPGN